VVATIATGLYVSWQGPLLIPSPTRLQGIFFWDLLIYLIEGFVFLLTGLQARTLIEAVGAQSWVGLGGIIAITAIVLVAARFIWVFPAIYLPRWLSPRLARRDPSPQWQWPFMLAFTGVRGAVSLAAALGIPLTLANGMSFPYRGEILVVTFGIIIVTLIGLGLALPAVIGWLGLARAGSEEREREQESERKARQEVLDVAQQRLHEITAEGRFADEITAPLVSYHESLRRELRVTVEGPRSPVTMDVTLRRELIEAERQHLHRMLREGRITDESRRRIERELDLEEVALISRSGPD
jgi:CPA1 family monovalent cation:H+ antiporter